MKKEKETTDYKPLKITCETQEEEEIIKALAKGSDEVARFMVAYGLDYTTTKAFLDNLK